MKREKIPRAFAMRAPPCERGRFPREITLFINLIAASKIKQRNRVNHSSSRCLFARNCVNRRNLRCNVVNLADEFSFPAWTFFLSRNLAEFIESLQFSFFDAWETLSVRHSTQSIFFDVSFLSLSLFGGIWWFLVLNLCFRTSNFPLLNNALLFQLFQPGFQCYMNFSKYLRKFIRFIIDRNNS